MPIHIHDLVYNSYINIIIVVVIDNENMNFNQRGVMLRKNWMASWPGNVSHTRSSMMIRFYSCLGLGTSEAKIDFDSPSGWLWAFIRLEKSSCSCGLLAVWIGPREGERDGLGGAWSATEELTKKRTTYNAAIWQDTYVPLFFSFLSGPTRTRSSGYERKGVRKKEKEREETFKAWFAGVLLCNRLSAARG